jgi:hypothetical protein
LIPESCWFWNKILKFVTMIHLYKHVSGYYPLSWFYLKHRPVYISTQRFGDWILAPSSGKTYPVRPNQ